MRLRRVFGWSLRIRAAPLGPWITPAVDSSAASMCRRSISSKGASSTGGTAGATCPASSLASAASVLPERSEEHTSELQSQSKIVCRLLLEKKNKRKLLQHHAFPVSVLARTTPHYP